MRKLDLVLIIALAIFPPFASAADARAYFDRETVRLANGDIDLALARFDEAIRLDPGDAQAHLRRGARDWSWGSASPRLRTLPRR